MGSPSPTRGQLKLVYFLPKYEPGSKEHFAHHYDFLAALAEQVELRLVVDKYDGPTHLPNMRLSRLHLRLPYFKLLEFLFLALVARLRGYRHYYVHYGHEAAIAFGLIARLMGGELFYWNCGMVKLFAPPADAPWWTRVGYHIRVPLPLIFRLTHYLVTGTPLMRQYYAEQYHLPFSKIKVLPNFINLNSFQPMEKSSARAQLGLPADKKILLYLHRLAPRKGAHYLVPLAQLMRQLWGDNYLLLVAGGGPYEKTLRAEIAAAGLENWFELRGWVANAMTPVFYSAADVFLMPSDEEGFPRVLLEAMACGCPFVASEVGGVKDVVACAQEPLLCQPGDLNGFVHKVAQLLDNAVWYNQLQIAGFAQVKQFSQERVLATFLQLLKTKQSADWAEFKKQGVA